MTYDYKIELANFSSYVSDFSPLHYGDQIIYTSQKGGKVDPWTGRSYSNLYLTNIEGTNINELPGNLNGKFHNGAITFVNDHLLVFTRNNSRKGQNNYYNLILALVEKKGKSWNFLK